MRSAYEGKLHISSLAVFLDGSLESISDRFSAYVGILASLFDSDMLLGEDFHLICSSSCAEHLGASLDLSQEFARRNTGSSDDGSGACDTTGHTLGHADEGHGSQVSSSGDFLNFLHGLRGGSKGSVDHEDNIFELRSLFTHGLSEGD